VSGGVRVVTTQPLANVVIHVLLRCIVKFTTTLPTQPPSPSPKTSLLAP
jgi:hypothetical protein